MREGKGKFEWIDDRKYEGQLQKNNINGFGVYTWPKSHENTNKPLRYKGNWKNNTIDGHGLLVWGNGSSYYG